MNERATDLTRADLARLTYHNACLRLEVRMLALALKAGYRPDQPRVPAGNPDGGQWTDDEADASARLASARPRQGGGRIRVQGRWQNATGDQVARLGVSQGRLRDALKAVRKVDPKWKPSPQAYETVEGYIRANEKNTAEAYFRLFELRSTRVGPGPYAVEWIPAPLTNRRLNQIEQREVNRIGRKYGCHWCGRKTPGTLSGNFIGDHQMPRSFGTSTRLYPHCIWCSASQGGLVRPRR